MLISVCATSAVQIYFNPENMHRRLCQGGGCFDKERYGRHRQKKGTTYIYLYVCKCMYICVDMYMRMNMIVSCMTSVHILH